MLTLQNLFNQKKYKNAAAAFQSVLKLSNGQFKQAKDRLDQIKNIINKQNNDIKIKRSSLNQELLKQILSKQNNNNNNISNNNDNDNE